MSDELEVRRLNSAAIASITAGPLSSPEVMYLDEQGRRWWWQPNGSYAVSGDGDAGAASTFTAGAVVQGAGRVTGHHQWRAQGANAAARMYVMPQGEPSGVAAAIKVFMDDYFDTSSGAAGDSYRDLGVYADRAIKGPNGAGSFLINAKVNQDFQGARPQIGISGQDGAAIPFRVVTLNSAFGEAAAATFAAACKGRWIPGASYAAGDTVYALGKGYTATTSGTAGTTKPAHTSGTASDGGVTWQFEFDNSASGGANVRTFVVIGDKDDQLYWTDSVVRAAGLHCTRDVVMYAGRPVHFLDASGARVARIYLLAGTQDIWIDDPTNTYGLRVRANAAGFMSLKGIGRLLGTKTVSDLSTTPSVAGTEYLIFGNASAVSVTSFSGGLPHQHVTVGATNGNTTLVHSASLRLVGDANKTLTANSRLVLIANSAGTAFVEQGYL